MPLIQEAKITFQQFEKWIISFCLTSIFKMELKWEIPIFHDFTSHTLCKYGHHHGLHLSRLKTSWRELCPACTVWMWAQWQYRKQNFHKNHGGTLKYGHAGPEHQQLSTTTPECWEKRVLTLLISSLTRLEQAYLSSIFQTYLLFHYIRSALQHPWEFCNTCPLPAPVPCSNPHSTPPFLSITLIRLFHPDYRLQFKNNDHC